MNAKTKNSFDPTRRAALIAGILYLITFATSIPAVFMLSPVLNNPNYIIGSGADAQVGFGAALDLANALACIGTAVALFWVIKRQNESLALGFVATRIFEAATIVVGVVSILAVVTLRQPAAVGADAATLVITGKALVAIRYWTFVIGPSMMPGFNALMLGTIMYKSRIVPRVIPAAGLVGAPILISSAIATMLGFNNTIWSLIGTIPIFFWELLIGVWMVAKGFKPSAPLIESISGENPN